MVETWAKRNAPPFAVLVDRREPLLDLKLKLLTPMFGGGVKPGQPDLSLPVRASAIRGHLRFWWRACVVAAMGSADELFAEEASIWGQAHRSGMSAAAPSAIEVDVLEERYSERSLRPCQVPLPDQTGKLQPHWTTSQPPRGLDDLAYVFWPFGESRQQPKAADALWDLEFRLRCYATPGATAARTEQLSRAVSAAVWAWVTFGGLGARTRRGCGALACQSAGFHPPSVQGASEWILRQANMHVRSGPNVLPVPALHGAELLIGMRIAEPIAAWREAVRQMKEYRQGVEVGRNRGESSNRPGRSRWPEPDSLRQQLPIPDRKHQPAHDARPYYPRADLGLPILFQRMGDNNVTVTMAASGVGTERMASPIILKPLAVADDGAVPLILLLKAPHVWDEETPGVNLTLNTTSPVSTSDLFDPVKSGGVKPMQGRQTAREGLMAFAQTQLKTAAHILDGSS